MKKTFTIIVLLVPHLSDDDASWPSNDIVPLMVLVVVKVKGHPDVVVAPRSPTIEIQSK